MGKKAHLQVLVWFRIKNFYCRRIWLTVDGEERNVAQRSLQFVSDSMEVARSKISNTKISLIIEVVTRHSQIAVYDQPSSRALSEYGERRCTFILWYRYY
jgi:DNA-binding MurR/RpiR family transcriptional regulator